MKVRGVVTLRDAFAPSLEWLVLDDGGESVWVQMSIAKANYPGVTTVALVVVPEPSAALALAGGSALLLGLRRRRR